MCLFATVMDTVDVVVFVGSAKLRAADPAAFDAAVARACRALADAEPEITRMDNIAGDGDCGLTLKSGAECMSCCYCGRHCVS